MSIGRWEIQFRAPYDGVPSGYYYWSNVHYVDVPDPAHAGPVLAPLFSGYTIVNYHSVQRNWHRLSVPPGDLPYVFDAFTFNDPGNSTLTGPIILENIARVHFYVGSRYAGYKLLRGTVGEGDYENGFLTDAARSRIEDNLTFYWFQSTLLTHTGEEITSLRCDPRLHHWNLRHGTKRRRQGVIHNP